LKQPWLAEKSLHPHVFIYIFEIMKSDNYFSNNLFKWVFISRNTRQAHRFGLQNSLAINISQTRSTTSQARSMGHTEGSPARLAKPETRKTKY